MKDLADLNYSEVHLGFNISSEAAWAAVTQEPICQAEQLLLFLLPPRCSSVPSSGVACRDSERWMGQQLLKLW